MAHSVIITTPRLTLDELGEQYGLSKAEQESLIRLVREKRSNGQTSPAQKSASLRRTERRTEARRKTN